MSLPEIGKIISVKEEPQTTPSLAQIVTRDKARETVNNYRFTPTLRDHFKRVFESVVHRKGQGFWVQAEYGAGKTHFLGSLIDLLIWRDENVWEAVREPELKGEYGGPISKLKMFPVAFSLRGLGQSSGADSLMRVFEEQIQESMKIHAPEIMDQVRVTSPELATYWYAEEANEDEKAGVANFFGRHHKCTPEVFLKQSGPRKFGQEIVKSGLAEGRLRSKYKERFTFIYDQITKAGGYDGLLFVIDEFRSWQDRHVEGTAAYAEDEEILETLAFVLPSQNRNIITVIASQGDMPQKLSGGGAGDRFIPLYLLADKNKNDFGEIIVFRSRELKKGATTDIKDFYDYCRKEYKFVKQSNISLDYFTSIFPFQPRCFDTLRRLTQSDERNNLPTIRSGLRMAWETLQDQQILKGHRLVTVSDVIRTPEMQKGLSHETYRAGYNNLCGAVEQLSELELAKDECDQAKRILETLYLWAISLPDNVRDGLTAQEIAEAAWLSDEAVGSTAQAEHLLERLVQGGFPIRVEKKTRDGKEVAVYSYEISAAQESPVKYFGPLKKKAKEDLKAQDSKWIESLFWQLPDITPEAQQELGVNGGILGDFQPPDQRSARDRQDNRPPSYLFPHSAGSSTRRVNKTAYSGEVVVADRWREGLGKEIENADQHFRLVYLTHDPGKSANEISSDLKDPRIAVVWPASLCADTREALADILAAEQMKQKFTAPNQSTMREYADGKRREALKAILKFQLDEFRRGKVATQKAYGIPAIEIFKLTKGREEDLAGRLLEKAYDTPLFNPKALNKEFTDADAKKVFAGLFQKEPAKAEKDAVLNFAVGLELTAKSHPNEFNPTSSQAVAKMRQQVSSKGDLPLADLKSAFCRPPYGLTESMVALYVFALLKSGGYELMLKSGSGFTLTSGKALPGDRITAHTLPYCDWNARLDRASLGARLVQSTQKGWNEVLPYARVLDASLKTAASPEEELARNDVLLQTLGNLRVEIPATEKSLAELAAVLGDSVPQTLKEIFARLFTLTAVSSYQEFDAVVRENYPERDSFASAHTQFENARRVRDQAFKLSQMAEYLRKACELDPAQEFDRRSLLEMLNFQSMLKEPSVIGARQERFERWKAKYVQTYRKAHRAHYEAIDELARKLENLRPKANALVRMNSISELGPPLVGTTSVPQRLKELENALFRCPEAEEPGVDGSDAICPKCQWRPSVKPPAAELDNVTSLISQGHADRFLRFKDATVSSILHKAAEQGQQPGLKELLQIIQLSNADQLAGFLNDELLAFLRKTLYDENLVSEQVPLSPIIQQVGAIEEGRVDEAISTIARLLTNAIKDAKAKHGHNKRVRVFLTLDIPKGDLGGPSGTVGASRGTR
jgi:hypothetical protein